MTKAFEMRALGDITIQANNGKLCKRDPSWKKLPPKLDSQDDENKYNPQAPFLKHNNSPHFTSPTMTSSSQAAKPMVKAATRTSTPTSFASSTTKSCNWVASTVKRVAMRRSADVVAHAKEESVPPRATRSDEFPPPPTSKPQNLTSPSLTRKPVHTDKPLPNPPIAQVTVSPSNESRSLLDASEKPLRRSSPGKPHQEEDWPVLFPAKLTTPVTLEQMTRPEDSYPSVRAMRIATREKLSARANDESKISSIQRKAVVNDLQSSPNQPIGRKPVHESDMRNSPATSRSKIAVATNYSSQMAREIQREPQVRTSAFKEHVSRIETSSPQNTVQKSVERLQDVSYTRPTKFSSIRARTPTARPSAEGSSSNKQLLDLSDTTADGNSATTGVNGFGFKGESMGTSRSPLAQHQTHNTGGVSRSHGGRTPSRPAVPSRDPEVAIQLSSSAPVPPLYSPPPNKPLPAVPKSQGPRQAGLGANANGAKAPTPELRKSSIPVPRRHVAGSARDLSSGTDILAKTFQKPGEQRSKHEPNSQVLEDAVSSGAMGTGKDLKDVNAAETWDVSPSSQRSGDSYSTKESEDQITRGKAMTEVPEAGTRVRRLSRLSPDYGPVLKISPSADKVIMGKGSSKEVNKTSRSKKDKDLQRTVLTEQLRKESFGGVFRPSTFARAGSSRPSSAAGDLQLPSRCIAKDSKGRERKAMSADAKSPSPTPARIQGLTGRQSSKARVPEHTANGTDGSIFDSKSEVQSGAELNHKEPQVDSVTESSDNPFQVDGTTGSSDKKPKPDGVVESRDIQSHTEVGASSDDAGTGSVHGEQTDNQIIVSNTVASCEVAEDDHGISPKYDTQGRLQFRGRVPGTPALPPFALQEQSSRAPNDFRAELFTQDTVSMSRKLNSKRSSPNGVGEGNVSPTEQKVTIGGVLTPPRQSSSTPGLYYRRPLNYGPNDFPPRSSSRAYVHDYTTELYQKCTASPKRLDPRISKDFQPIQERLGSSNGVRSIRYDPEASRSRRNSIARESNKTQASSSKGMLSNFRGLFHKRSSDASDHPSISSAKSGKRAAITAPSSPYPPISDIHPIHRPVKYCKVGSTMRPVTPEPLWGLSSRADIVSHSPNLSDTSITNSLAVQLIDSAKRAPPGPRQARLCELSNIMVQAITSARDAEKAKEEAMQAMEEAKLSARKAQMSCMLTHKRAADLARFLQEHKAVLE